MPCILPEAFESMERELQQQGKDILDLADMSSAQRLEFFKKHVGATHAEFMNKEYEKRMLGDYTRQRLMAAIERWTSEGIKPSIRKDLIAQISDEANADIFNAASSDEFLAQLAKTKLGFSISYEHAKELYDSVQTIEARKVALLSAMPNYETMKTDEWEAIFSNKDDPRSKLIEDYGASVVAYDLKYKTIRLAAQLKANGALEAANRVLGQFKSLKATLDMSYPRQLAGLLFINPKGTWKAFAKGAGVQWNFSKGGQNSGNSVMAMIYAMPNFMNGNMQIAGVDIGELEEAFPETWIGKGVDWIDQHLAKNGLQLGPDGTLAYLDLTARSEQGYKVALQLARANEFNRMYDLNNKLGGTFQDLLDQNIGGYINSATGRAEKIFRMSGSEVGARWLNVLLFAPKFFGAQIERVLNLRYALTDIKTVAATKSLEVRTPNQGRGRAAIGNVMLITAGILLRFLVHAMLGDKDPNDEEELWDMLNPISTIFGKIKIGDASFDLSFGTANNVRAVSQILAGKRKNINGQVRKVNPWDILSTVFEGKASPGFKTVWNVYRRAGYDLGLLDTPPKDFGWEELDWGGIAEESLSPILVDSVMEQYENGGNLFSIATLATLADFFGIGSNVYWPSKSDKIKDPEAFKVEKRILRQVGGNKINLAPTKTSKYLQNTTPKEYERRSEMFTRRLLKIYNDIMKDTSLTLEQKKKMFSDKRAELTKEMNELFPTKTVAK